MIIGTLILTFAGALAAQVNPLVLKYTVDQVEQLMKLPHPLKSGMSVLLLITVILFGKELISIFISFGQKFYGEKIRINISSELAQAAIERILQYRIAFFTVEAHESGKLQTRIDRGIESLTRLVQNFFINILPLFTNAVFALVIMYIANVYVGLVATSIIPLYFYVSMRQAIKLQGVRRQLRNQRENKNNGLLNLINSIMVIKSFVRESYERTKQYALQQELTENQLHTRRINFIYDAVKSFLEQIGVVLIILLTVYLVLDQQISLGAIMLHIMLFNNVSAPIRQLHRIYDEMTDAFIYAEGYFEILDAEAEIEPSGSIKPPEVSGHFVLKSVDFTYPNGTKALYDVSMQLIKDKTTALVGLSGAGKSTVVNLLCKFYQPDSGTITLDGINLNDYNNVFLREQIGLVLQKNHIFSGTIIENIRYGKLTASDTEVVEAARKAYLHDQVIQMPHGYDTNAQLVSGGQQQRIAIARLFLKDPPVIILDEPTTSLDAIASERIKDSLDAIKANRTVLIISHSLSQIIDADKIYVMDHGRVIESGTHSELYANMNKYREIFDAAARSLNLDKMLDTMR